MLVDSTRQPPAAAAITDSEAVALMKTHAAYTGKYDIDPTPTPDGKSLIANAPSGKLFVIDLASEKVIGTYPIPEAIGEITVDAAGDFAYVSCPQKGTIEVLNLRAAKLEEPIVMTPGVDGLEWIPGIS